MRWCVIGHPEFGKTVAPESALTHHEGSGWVKVSDWAGQVDAFNLADYTAPTRPTETATEKPQTKPAAKPKENE